MANDVSITDWLKPRLKSTEFTRTVERNMRENQQFTRHETREQGQQMLNVVTTQRWPINDSFISWSETLTPSSGH